MLGRHDVGHRVVVRYFATKHAGRPVFSDVLGQLIAMTETSVTLRTRGGEVTVALDSITAGKRIPDHRRLTATEALERVAAEGWPAPETAPLGDWLLRSAQGWTKRANSALAIGEPGRPIPAAVDAVIEWYGAHGQPPAITVPEPVGGRVIRELRGRGWAPSAAILVQTATIEALVGGSAGHPDTRLGIRLDGSPPAAWLALAAAHQGPLPEAARHILTSVRSARFAGLYDPADADGHAGDSAGDSAGQALAIGRGIMTDNREWLGLSLIEVAAAAPRHDPAAAPRHDPAAAPRHDPAAAIVGALAVWAAQEGASRAYLQVEEENHEAVTRYERLGFGTHHRYATWQPSS